MRAYSILMNPKRFSNPYSKCTILSLCQVARITNLSATWRTTYQAKRMEFTTSSIAPPIATTTFIFLLAVL